MTSGDPILDGLFANLNTAGVPYKLAAEAGDAAGVLAATPAVQAASDALMAYTVPIPIPPPPPPPPPAPTPPTGPLQLARIPAGVNTTEVTRNADGSCVIRVLCSSDIVNGTIGLTQTTKSGADSGVPIAGVLTFAKATDGTPLKLAKNSTVNIRGWTVPPGGANGKATPFLTFTLTA